MSRVIDEPIAITTNANGLPSYFAWRNHRHHVSNVLEEWRDTGCWWDGEGEKAFYLLQDADGGVYELYHDFSLKQWRLYRVLD